MAITKEEMFRELKRLRRTIAELNFRPAPIAFARSASANLTVTEDRLEAIRAAIVRLEGLTETVIGHVDDLEAKLDIIDDSTQEVVTNTDEVGGNSIGDSLVEGGTRIAEGVISGGATIIGSMLVAGGSVLIAGGIGIATIVSNLLDNSDLIESDVNEIRKLEIDQKNYYVYGATWTALSTTNFRLSFDFPAEMELLQMEFDKVSGLGVPKLDLIRFDGQDSSIMDTFHTQAGGPTSFTVHFDRGVQTFAPNFRLRIDLGLMVLGDIWTVRFYCKHQSQTLPTRNQFGSAFTETITQNEHRF